MATPEPTTSEKMRQKRTNMSAPFSLNYAVCRNFVPTRPTNFFAYSTIPLLGFSQMPHDK
jgi:hypothetical protein